MIATFESVVLFFWRKLMNLPRPSVTTNLQHRADGYSNGCSSLAFTILYIMKKYPLFVFFKCGWNILNSYNSKTHVIRTNLESSWGFELYEFNGIFIKVEFIMMFFLNVFQFFLNFMWVLWSIESVHYYVYSWGLLLLFLLYCCMIWI